jgi:nucleoside-diphosphate-sugar epimerase
MSSVTQIAIAGFTGKMARLITNSLLTRHHNIQIHGLCRSPSKVDTKLLSNPNIKVFEADSTDAAALRRGLAGTSVCICCYLGSKDLMIDGQKTLIDACIAENVPRYIASDWSLDFRGLKIGDHPNKDPMKHVQAYLEEKEAAGKIQGVHVLNGAFTEVMWAPLLGVADAKEGVFRYFGTGDEKYDMTTYADAAAFTAEVAADPTAIGFINGESLRKF